MTSSNAREMNENHAVSIQRKSSKQDVELVEQGGNIHKSNILTNVDDNVDQSVREDTIIVPLCAGKEEEQALDQNKQTARKTPKKSIEGENILHNDENDDLDKTHPTNKQKIETMEMKMTYALQNQNEEVGSHHEASSPHEPLQESVQLGDHVYKFCSFAGIPGVIQHHGIVTGMNENALTIVDFDKLIRDDEDAKIVLIVKRRRSRLQLYEGETSQSWKFVTYKAGWITRSVGRSGTCTAVESDNPALVLSRVQFLLDNRKKLPRYHFLKANSECVAVWCKTGTWATLQASSFLHTYAAGQVKSASTLALYVSSQQVTVPSTGLWGYLGYTTKVSLLSTQPYLLPAVAGYGLITIGGPMWILSKCKSTWNKTTETMNHEFWEEAIRQPDTFAECMTKWSQL